LTCQHAFARGRARDAKGGCHLSAAAPRPRTIPLRAPLCPLASHCNYTWARQFHAQLERFVGRDPVAYESGDFNVYCYVLSIPTNASDPFGLKFVGNLMSCTPCMQPYMQCAWRNGMMYAVCTGKVSVTGIIELGGCAAFCSWLGWTGPGYAGCVTLCTGSVCGMQFLLTLPHCNLALHEGEMKCGREYNMCAFRNSGCGCGPGNENWRPD